MLNVVLGGTSLLLLFLAFLSIGTRWAGILGFAAMLLVWLKMVGDARVRRRSTEVAKALDR